MTEKAIYKIEIRAYSKDWDQYIRHYTFLYKSDVETGEVAIICKNDEVSPVHTFETEEATEYCRLKIIVIAPETDSLSPLNMIINVFKNNKLIDVRRYTRKWDKDNIGIDLVYESRANPFSEE